MGSYYLRLRYHRRPAGRCSSPIDSWKHGKLGVGSNEGATSTDQLVNSPCELTLRILRTPGSSYASGPRVARARRQRVCKVHKCRSLLHQADGAHELCGGVVSTLKIDSRLLAGSATSCSSEAHITSVMSLPCGATGHGGATGHVVARQRRSVLVCASDADLDCQRWVR